jgi:hypothetical protein
MKEIIKMWEETNGAERDQSKQEFLKDAGTGATWL